MAGPPRTIAPRLVLLLCGLVSVASVLMTLFVWFVLLTPAAPEVPRVSFAEFLGDVHAGRVEEVRIDGTDYAFWKLVDGRRVDERTTGPRAGIAQVRALRPSDPLASPPRVFFTR